MSDYVAKLKWSLGDGTLEAGGYNVKHRMRFAIGHEKNTFEQEEMHKRAHSFCFVANALICGMKVIL